MITSGVLVRTLVLGGLCITMDVNADYSARLSFENLTRGTSNSGALLASVGDAIGIRFNFAGGASRPNQWGILQMLLCDSPVLSSAEADTWAAQLTSSSAPASDFLFTSFVGNSNLYDNALDPTDPTGENFVCHGSYGGFHIKGNSERTKNWNVVLFQFTASGSVGDELRWVFENRGAGQGLSTRILDFAGKSVKVTDNYVLIVPEPGGAAMLIGFGAASILMRRRR